MELLKKENIASVTLFDLRLSEGELMVYESCIEYVLKNCSEELIYEITGCESKAELATFQEDLIDQIKLISERKYLPKKYSE